MSPGIVFRVKCEAPETLLQWFWQLATSVMPLTCGPVSQPFLWTSNSQFSIVIVVVVVVVVVVVDVVVAKVEEVDVKQLAMFGSHSSKVFELSMKHQNV